MITKSYTTIYMNNVLNTHFLDVFYQKMVGIQTFCHLIFICPLFLPIAIQLGIRMKT